MSAKKFTVAERDFAVAQSAYRFVCTLLDADELRMLDRAAERAFVVGNVPYRAWPEALGLREIVGHYLAARERGE